LFETNFTTSATLLYYHSDDAATARIPAFVDAIVGVNQYGLSDCRCAEAPPDDCEPSQSSFVGDDKGDGGGTESVRLVTATTSTTGAGNDLAVVVTALTATFLLLAAMLTVACFWRRRRCIAILSKHRCIAKFLQKFSANDNSICRLFSKQAGINLKKLLFRLWQCEVDI